MSMSIILVKMIANSVKHNALPWEAFWVYVHS